MNTRILFVSLVLALGVTQVVWSQHSYNYYNEQREGPSLNATAAHDQGVHVVVEIPTDSTVGNLNQAELIRVAETGAKTAGWSINAGSPYAVIIRLRIVPSNSTDVLYYLEANGGFEAVSAEELLNPMGTEILLEKSTLVAKGNFMPLLADVQALATKVAKRLNVSLMRRELGKDHPEGANSELSNEN